MLSIGHTYLALPQDLLGLSGLSVYLFFCTLWCVVLLLASDSLISSSFPFKFVFSRFVGSDSSAVSCFEVVVTDCPKIACEDPQKS